MIWDNLINSIKDRFTGLNSEQKRMLVIICTACFSVILTLAVVVSVAKNSPAKEDRLDDNEKLLNIPIPAEELFLPEEPDFLPGVLLDRERREIWTETDAQEFWQDPLRDGEEYWRIKFETAVDELLERVP